jgi:hypothetical protein
VQELLSKYPVTEFPHIAAWREVYKAFGAKPQKTRNSLEALTRRAEGGLPRVNRLTDISQFDKFPKLHRKGISRTMRRVQPNYYSIRQSFSPKNSPWKKALSRRNTLLGVCLRSIEHVSPWFYQQRPLRNSSPRIPVCLETAAT